MKIAQLDHKAVVHYYDASHTHHFHYYTMKNLADLVECTLVPQVIPPPFSLTANETRATGLSHIGQRLKTFPGHATETALQVTTNQTLPSLPLQCATAEHKMQTITPQQHTRTKLSMNSIEHTSQKRHAY